ncbi:MAG: twin-arginine translocase TatA/TatE family subunit [Thermoguttaceae bacterium]
MLYALLSPGPSEIILILAVGVLLFGKRLPEIGKQLGKSLLDFQRGFHDMGKEADKTGEAAKSEDAQPVSNIPAKKTSDNSSKPTVPDDTPKFEL